MKNMTITPAISTKSGRRTIAFVHFKPDSGGFRIYVAWEWKLKGQRKDFGIVKSTIIYHLEKINLSEISRTMDYGIDIGHTEEARNLFPKLD